ncbi:Metallo-dependent hydrolase [Schizopora paradoxa]|uniref:Metallo-dependent hydrolase n=1 Tax=Schizopora paradoxa TaxID=27342 RepID=A0A0H2ST87_9AGAM|nr:Metallo-dependent hydrolase [Schizopora paradoxa]
MSPMHWHSRVWCGTLIDCPRIGQVRIRENQTVVVNQFGFIESVEGGPQTEEVLRARYPNSNIQILSPGCFLFPAFCDLHLHAPQFLYQGTGLHLPLMQWLEKYAFKAEERIDADPELARRTYTCLAKRLKEHGTGTVLLFGTIKERSNLILAEVMQSEGIRAFVGKLSMDKSSSKTYVEPSPTASLEAAKNFVETVRSLNTEGPKLVEPVITPRFVPTCSDELLDGLGKLAKDENVRIQSHLAEARDQVNWVERERGKPDIDVFDAHGLLTPRTIQAHCTFLGPACFDRLHDRGTAIAHCPLSNAYFSSQPFKLREALDFGVKVGLGTDIAGGYSIDIMNSMRTSVLVSRMREGQRTESLLVPSGPPVEEGESVSIDWKDSLYLATRGGAVSLGLPENAGRFEVGSPFDAQLIQLFDGSTQEGVGPLDFIDGVPNESAISEEMLEKWWCIGDMRNRIELWVQGRKCYERRQ